MVATDPQLEAVRHLTVLSGRELSAFSSARKRQFTYLSKRVTALRKSLGPGVPIPKATGSRLVDSVERVVKNFKTSIDRVQTANLYQIVMLVTCVEAYLEDVLSAAARIDSELMAKSEQRALYAEVIGATSIEELAHEMRMRWARAWVRDGGPDRWIASLSRMGVADYPADLPSKLERIWGMRHVVVHRAGKADAAFVKRHPGVVSAPGDRVTIDHGQLTECLEAVNAFMEPTERYFLSRWPGLVSG